MADEMRNILYQSIYELMKEDERIVVVGPDFNKPNGLIGLKDTFPERLVNVGIAEQNMAGIGAGLAAQGLIPFIHTFSAFASRRICDQVAISICYAESNVKIIGTEPGIMAELNGGTHIALEDIGVLRSIPNIRIMDPADGIELRQMVAYAAKTEGPVYIRMTRREVPDIHDQDYIFEAGKADLLREGKDVGILASGSMMVYEALAAAETLASRGIEAEVLNIHTIKPIDADAIVRTAKKTRLLVTAENHNILGGLRSAVAEVVTEQYPVRILPIGIKDIKGEVGKLDYLKKQFGLTADDIVAAVEKGFNS